MTEIIERPMNAEEIAEREAWAAGAFQRKCDEVTAARHAAYVAPGGSDSIFMQYQRGEATKQEWLDAVQAINDANPYPIKAK